MPSPADAGQEKTKHITTLDDWLRPREDERCRVSALHRTTIRLHTSDERSRLRHELEARQWLGSYCGCLAEDVLRHERLRALDNSELGGEEEGRKSVRKWLFECGVPFRALVRAYYYNHDPHSIETTWKVFIRYWPVFLAPRDVVVTGADFQWVLAYCDEASSLIFGTNHTKPPWEARVR